MIRWRRLVRGYEARLGASEAMIHIAMGSLLVRHIPHWRISKQILSS